MDKKKNYGQFFTPDEIAESMVFWCLHKGAKTILDPTTGPGVFLEHAYRLAPFVSRYGYEIDFEMLKEFQKKHTFESELICGDYLEKELPFVPEAIVCNPPYIRFQEIKNRKELVNEFEQKYGVKLNGSSNYCIYFLIKSMHELAVGGRCAYLIPYEFLNTGYGKNVKRHLLETGMLKAILKFDNSKRIFEDAVTTACILLLEKDHKTNFDENRLVNEDIEEDICFVNIQDMGELHFFFQNYEDIISREARNNVNEEYSASPKNPSENHVNDKQIENTLNLNIIFHKISTLQPENKWINYFLKRKGLYGENNETNYFSWGNDALEKNKSCSNLSTRGKLAENLIPLREYAYVKRGIATGNNPYFTYSEAQRIERGLSLQASRPCIIKSRDIQELIFCEESYKWLRDNNKKVYIFDGCKAKTKADQQYIAYGEENGFHTTFLTRHRTPWYKIETKEPAPIWVSVFNRKQLKVIRNEMMIHSLTTFHGIYVAEKDANLLFCYLLTPIAQEIIFQNKREYGEGLDKFEPGDLNDALILDLSLVSKEHREKVESIYAQLNGDGRDDLIQELDAIFRFYIGMRKGKSDEQKYKGNDL